MSDFCLELQGPFGRIAVAGPHILAIEEINADSCHIYVSARPEPLLAAESYDQVLLRIELILAPKPTPNARRRKPAP